MKRRILFVIVAVVLIFGWANLASAKYVCKVGDKVKILREGKWVPGTVKKVKDKECLVNPDGQNSKSNEWVKADALRYKGSKYQLGDTVYVKWQGKWWLSEIKFVEENRWKVHYKGQSDLWDEWVTEDKIREYKNDY